MSEKEKSSGFGSPALGLLFAGAALIWSTTSLQGILMTAGIAKFWVAIVAFGVGYIFIEAVTFVIGGLLAAGIVWWLLH